jgi:hypothetical protein
MIATLTLLVEEQFTLQLPECLLREEGAMPWHFRILKQLELHSTPVHGSWLNMGEIELSALARQCLSRRIGTQEELEREVLAWQQHRNEEATIVNWRFTTADARIKLKRLYPSLEPRKRPSKKNNVANLP